MFAGAAREAVFSNPEVIQWVNEYFVPVALKARELNRPPETVEGDLYREIARSRPLPQGICVADSAGKVLRWAVAFDDEASVLDFLSGAVKQYNTVPGADRPVIAKRYMRYPSQRMEDMEASAVKIPIPKYDGQQGSGAGASTIPEGVLDAKMVGRAVKPNGELVENVLQQEYYAEDRFTLGADLMSGLAERLLKVSVGKQKLPVPFFRPMVARAYMGVLDVAPIFNPGPEKGELIQCDFWAEPLLGRSGWWKISGESETYNGEGMANSGPGDLHRVKLRWNGFVNVKDGSVVEIVLKAEGSEQLKFGTVRNIEKSNVAQLPSGHTINLDSAVRYGIVAKTLAAKTEEHSGE